MSQSTLSGLVSQWFADYTRLAYWLSRRWCRRFMDHRALDYSATDLDELSQDGISRGFDRFAKRCARYVCGESDRKRWVCQCVIRGARDAIRSKSRFGSLTDGATVRDDAMNRCRRVRPGFVHGDDCEKRDALESVHYEPIVFAVQRWELEDLVNRELPPNLRTTALYAACGLTQDQSAILQGVTDRTVRNRLQELRQYLDPSVNVYGVVCSALATVLDKHNKRGGQVLGPILADALAG